MRAGCDGARPRGSTASPALVLVVLLLGLAGCGDDPVGTMPTCGQARPLTPGELEVWTLSGDDPRREGSFIDYYSLRLSATAAVAVEMRPEPGSEVDPFLYLWRDGDDEAFAQAFDPRPDASDPVARLEADLGAGCYVVGASTWAGEEGLYSIRATLDPS